MTLTIAFACATNNSVTQLKTVYEGDTSDIVNVVALKDSISLDPNYANVYMYIMDTMSVQLNAPIYLNNLATWTSSNHAVAVVDSTGFIRATGKGLATIYVSLGFWNDSIELNVDSISRIIVSPADTSIALFDSLTYQAWPCSPTVDELMLVEEQSGQATIPQYFKFERKNLGFASQVGKYQVRATLEGQKSENVEGKVINLVDSISLSPKDTTLFLDVNQGFSYQMYVHSSGGQETHDISSYIQTWSSSDPSVAGIDAHGNITPIDTGTTTISAAFESFRSTVQLKVRYIDSMILLPKLAALDIPDVSSRPYNPNHNYQIQLVSHQGDTGGIDPCHGGTQTYGHHLGSVLSD